MTKKNDVIRTLFEQDVKHLERLKKLAPKGRWETRPYPTLADPFTTILKFAKSGTATIAISDASPKWWEQAVGWLEANAEAIERGIEFIRIFIVDDEKDLGPHDTLSREFLEVMGKVSQEGVQINIVKTNDLPPNTGRDLLLVNVEIPDASDPWNNSKRILATNETISAITVFAKDRIRPIQYIVSENPTTVSEEVDAATKIYRTSTRFPHPDWYPAGMNWLDVYYDEGYKKISGAYRNDFTEKEIDFLTKILRLTENSKARILDHGCGFGRLMIPLLKRLPNISIVGFDQSRSYIAELNAKLEKENLAARGRAFVGDFERLNEFLPIIGEFDCVISMFSSFGHDFIPGSQDVKEIIAEQLIGIRNALRDRGKLILDLNNYGDIKQASGKFSTAGDVARFDRFEEGQDWISRKRLTQFVLVDRKTKKYHSVSRNLLFTKEELERKFKSIGLNVDGVFGNFVLEKGEAVPYLEGKSPRMVFVATKR